MKTCGTCNKLKDYNSFYKDPRGCGDGYRSYCIDCHKIKTYAYKKKNKTYLMKKNKEWCANNIERLRANERRYYQDNKETRGAHRIRQQEYKKQGLYVEKYTRIEIFERDKWVCQICFTPVDKKLREQRCGPAPTIDHIIPTSKGGPDCPDNVQLAHKSCNSRKYNTLAPTE